MNSVFKKCVDSVWMSGSYLQPLNIRFKTIQYTRTQFLSYLSQDRILSHLSSSCLARSHNSNHRSILSQYRSSCSQLFGTVGSIRSQWYCTKSNQTSNLHSDDALSSSSAKSESSEFKLVYTAPLKGAVRAIKVFSLGTATAAVSGGPVLVWLGNPSVPLSGRIIMSSLVMLVGISTTALLHWLVKGYVIQIYYNEESKMVQLYTLSLFGRKKLHEFSISEAKPPSTTAFSSFQARGKSYFVHAEVFQDQKIMSRLLGVYADIETSDV